MSSSVARTQGRWEGELEKIVRLPEETLQDAVLAEGSFEYTLGEIGYPELFWRCKEEVSSKARRKSAYNARRNTRSRADLIMDRWEGIDWRMACRAVVIVDCLRA